MPCFLRRCCSEAGGVRGRCDVVVGVVGQPNVGKSTLFNVLTGNTERVGNFPGTTVAMSIGRTSFSGKTLCLVDLPGIYSLRAVTIDEKIARDYILFGDWDALLVLVDPLVGKTGFFLAIQVLQLTNRAVVALTKWDEVEKLGITIDVEGVERVLGVPVVPVSALRRKGLDELMKALISVVSSRGRAVGIRVDYGPLEGAIEGISKAVSGALASGRIDPRGVAVLIAMGNSDIVDKLGLRGLDIRVAVDTPLDDYVAQKIYGFIWERL